MTRPRTFDDSAAATRLSDANAILASIGLVAYDWRIDFDLLTWGANAPEVLQIADLARIASGRGYAGLLDPKNTTSRFDAVTQTGGHDFAAACRIRPNTVSIAARAARSGSGSRITDAGSPSRMAPARRARTASCGSSPSVTNTTSGSPTCRGSTS